MLPEFDMPSFRNPDGTVMVWDAESHSYVTKPSAGLEQDRGHSTGGDNDLFNQDQLEHSELAGVPELEGYMSNTKTAAGGFDMKMPAPWQRRPWESNCPSCRGTLDKNGECRRCDFGQHQNLAGPDGGDIKWQQPNAGWGFDSFLNDLLSPLGLQGLEKQNPEMYSQLHDAVLQITGGLIPEAYHARENWDAGKKFVIQQLQKSPEWAHLFIPNADLRPQFDREYADQFTNGVVPKTQTPSVFDQLGPREYAQLPEKSVFSAEWAPAGKVLCPQCSEATNERACPQCGKDLTPEWNNQADKNNEFFGIHPPHDNTTEHHTFPDIVPKRNREKTDDSYPSMSLSKTYEMAQRIASRQVIAEEDWDDFFSQGGSKVEIGKWLLDRNGAFHFDHGMHALHENIAARDGIRYPQDVAALGSVYNDGTADTQRVDDPTKYNQQSVQAQIDQAFGQVTLSAPVGQNPQATKGVAFQPVEITGGTWLVAPNRATQFITGIAWVKGVAQEAYNPRMILVAEHLQPEDFELYHQGCAAIITATGGMSSHAAYLASTMSIPTIVGLGEGYSKIENGNYLKIDPQTQVITVMPGADSSMSPEQKQQISDQYIQYQMNRGGSLKPTFAHVDEETAWKLAHPATLDACPECNDVMMDQGDKVSCHSCGHTQPIIRAQAAVLAPLGEAAIGGLAEMGGGAAAGGAAEGAGGLAGGGGGISGIGNLMNSALGRGNPLQNAYYTDKLLGGGQQAGDGAGAAAPEQTMQDPSAMQGIISKVQIQKEAGVWGTIIENLVNMLQKAPEAFTDPKNPLSYADDVAGLASGAGGQQQYMSSIEVHAGEHWAAGGPGDDNVGMATDNRGENSDPEHDGSGASFKEKGDSPELLKDVDGPGDAKGDAFPQDDLKNQGDPALQEKALKSLHMNLPLVIEFSKSPEPGSENPILQALDAILEEAFPGYKDGTDGESEQKEHPADEGKSEDESGEKPEDGDSSNGEEKPDPKEASVWHFAFNGHDDDCTCDKCEEFESTAPESEWLKATDKSDKKESARSDYDHWNEDADHMWWQEEGRHPEEPPENDPYDDYQNYSAEDAHYEDIYEQMKDMSASDLQAVISAPENFFEGDPKHIVQMAQDALADAQYHEQRLQDTGPTGLAGLEQPTAKTAFAPMAPGQVQVGADNGVATLPPAAPAAAPVCPMCGQTHAPGTACPAPAVNNVQQPAATGAPITPPQPNAVVTKWHIVTVEEKTDEDEDEDEDDSKVVELHEKQYGPNDTHNIKASFDDEFGFFTASDEPHHEHEVEHKKDEDDSIADDGSSDDIDSSSDTPWVDDSGAPLQEGMDYELKANSYAIPDRVTVDRILPDKIQYTLHGGDVDYQDEVTKEQLDLDGISFTPVGGGDTYDSEDGFQDWNAEAPVRPGQDATPQQDDLSTPTTVVSHEEFAPISLETYTGSFRGDAPDDRSWLMGESSEVAVDPSLMAKFAGKDFSAREQRAFIDESGEARNLDLLKLEGTHYVMDDVDAHFNW